VSTVGLWGGRDTQKTQHGIETVSIMNETRAADVETLRKPSTGLKPFCDKMSFSQWSRDTQKTQHGIETKPPRFLKGIPSVSRHSENPARD